MSFHIALVIARLALVVAGLILVYISYQARKKIANKPPFVVLSVAFLLITLGAVIEGILSEFFQYSLVAAHTIEALITAVGFALVLYAIYVTKD
ncbi:MAG: hypothetical protein NXY59_01965 [Aigarchaeota archaeon]|nr:hypothetical protein [Candidatus Pelearchaeum maunauluense]